MDCDVAVNASVGVVAVVVVVVTTVESSIIQYNVVTIAVIDNCVI